MNPVFRERLRYTHAADPALDATAPKVVILPAELDIDIAANPAPGPLSHQCHRVNVIAADEAARQKVVHANKPTRIPKLLNRRVSEACRAAAKRGEANLTAIGPEPIIGVQWQNECDLRGVEANIPGQREARVDPVSEHRCAVKSRSVFTHPGERQLSGIIGRSVVDDDQIEIAQRLPANRFQRFNDVFGIIL
jgi:hypothetical protein